MKSNLHILFIASWYPNKKIPDNGDFVQRHAKAISHFCKVSVLHVTSDKHLKKSFEIAYKEDGNVTETIVYYKPSKLLKLKKYYDAFHLGLKQILKRGAIDLIHLNVMSPGGLAAVKIKKQLQVPLVITEHWTAFLDTDPTPMRWLDKKVIQTTLSHCDILTPVSIDLGNAIKKWQPDLKIEVVPNVVDTRLFKFKEKSTHETFHLIHVSTLNNQQKNITGLLKAFKHAYEKDNRLKLTLIGKNIEAEYLQYIETHKLQHAIAFIAHLPHPQIAEKLQEADGFVLFSNYENLPCVIVEALACGLPVISTEVGGISEMINDTNGILIEAKNEKQLTTAILKLKSTYHQFDLNKISLEAKEKYDFLTVGKQYINIYNKLLNLE